MTRKEMEDQINSVLTDTTWKGPAIVGAVLLIVFILLNSVLFALMVALVKVVILLGSLLAFGYALYLAYPIILRKINER